MQIREATEADIPAIVALLRSSLGESLLPKTERYWRWKHVENPFGPSPVLLCWEGMELIGVRAFMRWEWLKEGKIYHAVRAVDTATHPKHQGKGIFKKLTMALIDSCKERGVDFVFNTPNNQSKPGYLKMGWSEAGRLPISWKIFNPVRMAKNVLIRERGEAAKTMDNGNLKFSLESEALPALIQNNFQRQGHFVTNVSLKYLKWRYEDVPVAYYYSLHETSGNELNSLLIYRLKQTRFGRELRIVDCFFTHEQSVKSMKKQLNENMKLWDVDYCTISGLFPHAPKILGGFSLKAAVGPSVTTRPMNVLDLSSLENFKNWSPSVGDLELF